MRLPSASSLQRVAACPASAVLPQVNTTSGAASRGTALHEFVCNARSYGVKKALEMAPKEVQEQCSVMQLAPLHGLVRDGMIAHEVTFAYDVTTGKARQVGVNLNRDYQVTDNEFVGTADIFADMPDRVVVLDMKTGRHPVAPAAVNWQLRSLALMSAMASKKQMATVVIAYLQDDGGWIIDQADLDAIDLDAIEMQLQTLAKKVKRAAELVEAGKTPDVSPAEETCRWCPAVRACPATTALVRVLPPTLADIQTRLSEMTSSQLGESWLVMERAEAALKIIREGLTAIARQSPFALPNGKTLRVVEGQREYIDGNVAQRILVEKYSPEIAIKACKPTVSKASLKTALGKRADDAIEAIRAAGGISVTTTTTVKES